MLNWLTDEQRASRDTAAVAQHKEPVADGGAADRRDNWADVLAPREGAGGMGYAITVNQLRHCVTPPGRPVTPAERAA